MLNKTVSKAIFKNATVEAVDMFIMNRTKLSDVHINWRFQSIFIYIYALELIWERGP